MGHPLLRVKSFKGREVMPADGGKGLKTGKIILRKGKKRE
jgi:hypothetical protein